MNKKISSICAINGLCSRADAKKFIRSGLLTFNNSIIKEDIIVPSDIKLESIKLLDRAINIQSNKISVLLHKPQGYLSTFTKDSDKWSKNLLINQNKSDDDTNNNLEPSKLRDLIPIKPLNYNTSGLLIYTQDHSLPLLLDEVDEEYHVVFVDYLSESSLFILRGENYLDGILEPPLKVQIHDNRTVNISIKGSANKLKRVCQLAGLEIKYIKRVRLGNIKLDQLPLGQWKFIRKYELINK